MIIIDGIARLIGKKVEVIASDISYTGILIEVSEEEVNLQGELQWIAIPLEGVISIKLLNH